MSSLKDSIARLAESFATQVLAAIRSASLEDIAALSGGRVAAPRAAAPSAAAAPAGGRRRPGRPPRVDVAGLAGKVGDLLGKNADGMRAEQIRGALGVAKNQLVKVINKGLADGSLKKTGEKRATKYFVGSGTPAAAPNKARRGRKKKG